MTQINPPVHIIPGDIAPKQPLRTEPTAPIKPIARDHARIESEKQEKDRQGERQPRKHNEDDDDPRGHNIDVDA